MSIRGGSIYRKCHRYNADIGVAERKANDEVFVKDLLDGVFNVKLQDGDIEKMYRLGRWAEDKARPPFTSNLNLFC